MWKEFEQIWINKKRQDLLLGAQLLALVSAPHLAWNLVAGRCQRALWLPAFKILWNIKNTCFRAKKVLRLMFHLTPQQSASSGEPSPHCWQLPEQASLGHSSWIWKTFTGFYSGAFFFYKCKFFVEEASHKFLVGFCHTKEYLVIIISNSLNLVHYCSFVTITIGLPPGSLQSSCRPHWKLVALTFCRCRSNP